MPTQSVPAASDRSRWAASQMILSSPSNWPLQPYQEIGSRFEVDRIISPESSVSHVEHSPQAPLAMVLSLKALPPITPKQKRWCLTASCTSGIMFLVAAVAVIFFTTQRPLGFVFLGLAVLSVLVGCYPRRFTTGEQCSCPTQTSERGVQRLQGTSSGPQCVSLELGTFKQDLALQPSHQRNPSTSVHAVLPMGKDCHQVATPSSGPKRQVATFSSFKGIESGVSLLHLDKPARLVPLKKPLAKSAMTQSSASVRPRLMEPSIAYESIPRVYHPKIINHHSQPSQSTMSEREYAMINAAVQDAYSTT